MASISLRISLRPSPALRNPSVLAVAGVATGDGIVKSIIGDEIGDGTSEGDGEMGSEPDVHSGEGGVYTGGAGGVYVGTSI
ncbi:hypothetical protein Tco_0230082 [Tanacetum coccineum]